MNHIRKDTPHTKGGAENNSLLKESHVRKEKVDLMLAMPLTGAKN